MGFAISLQVVGGIFQPYLVCLQEAIQFVASLKAEQPLKLGRGKLSFPVGFQCEGLKNATGSFAARRRQCREKFVWDIERYLRHNLRITQTAAGEAKAVAFWWAFNGLLMRNCRRNRRDRYKIKKKTPSLLA